MILFPLIFGCMSQEDDNQFGVVYSTSEQTFDSEETSEPEDSSTEDSSTEDSDYQPNSTPFSVDSSVVCGDRAVGTEVGDCALNFALFNQDSELVELHSFVNSVVFLDLSDFT